MRTLREFWDNVVQDDPDGCWEWQGFIHRGYGRYRNQQAHRVALALVGRPVASGLTVDHLCRNRACVNPSHLEAVTNRVNTLRGIGPTAVNAQKTECRAGHSFTPENVYVIPSTGSRVCRKCNTARTIAWRKRRTVSSAEAAALTSTGFGAFLS